MRRIGALVTMLVVGVGVASADLWWYAYEATKYPEDVGWGRYTRAGGAERSLQDGALVIDSLASTDICDSYYQYMPSLPGPAEVFRVDWRLRVDEVIGFADPCISAWLAPSSEVTLLYNTGEIYSLLECYTIATYVPGVFHDYVLISADLQTYTLYIDGQMVHEGGMASVCDPSHLSWGDMISGGASLSAWDYVRFGVVPAPQAGDVNCDGSVDFADINPFVLALTDTQGYQQTYPGCWLENADINSDGSVDFGDINPFIEVLTS